MKNVCHGMLECRVDILEAKRHDMICESNPWGSECGFVLMGWLNIDLVVARETVQEVQILVVSTIIDNLVDKRSWKIVFGIGVIEITKVSATVNNAIFFVDKDGVGDP
jgi:hypothetical protein